ncbi:MAG: hypothetical protein QG592_957 [Pseudomonadota bacterium]|nr:hypothetical protein [Pseudomonadota bacterium]MDQ5959877.1 hypothetical protein [Pseudomonadota bacterium]
MIESASLTMVDSLEEGSNSLSSLLEDAVRYRWLRKQQAANCWPQVVDGLHRLVGDELDATIDDAMRGDCSASLTARLN